MNEKNLDEKKEISFLASSKIIIVESFSSTTAHALPNIFRTSCITLKVIWIVCFLASSAYCLKSVIVSLQDFLEYPSYISTTVVQEIPTQFPAVTFCNLKYVNKTASASFFGDPRFKALVLDPKNFNSTWEFIRAQNFFEKSLMSSDALNETQRTNVGYRLSDMLLSCTFNFEPCYPSDFVYSYHSLYGHCYTFNKGVDQNGTAVDVKTVAITGSMYGLVMELFLGHPDVESAFEYRDGVILSITNQSQVPFTEDVKTMASTGAETDFIVSRNYITKLEAPYSGNCLHVAKNTNYISYYYDYIINTLGVSYTQGYCFQLCVQNDIIDACGCTNIYFPTFEGNKTFCTTQALSTCMFDVIYNFVKSHAAEECKNACPFECESIEYETQTFRSTYPTEYYKKILLGYSKVKYSGLSQSNLDKAVAKVNVYYKNLLYTRTEEKIQTSTEDIFSNIGGTLGLYIGISLLSLVEVVELFINLLVAFLSARKNGQQVVDQNKSES